MKTQELRIGNYVFDTYNNYMSRVDEIDEIGITTDNGYSRHQQEIENYEPIPLDEFWLTWFNFTKYASGRFYITTQNDNRIYFNLTDNVVCEITNKHGIHFMYSEVKYLHQLQNLYFALTGLEL